MEIKNFTKKFANVKINGVNQFIQPNIAGLNVAKEVELYKKDVDTTYVIMAPNGCNVLPHIKASRIVFINRSDINKVEKKLGKQHVIDFIKK